MKFKTAPLMLIAAISMSAMGQDSSLDMSDTSEAMQAMQSMMRMWNAINNANRWQPHESWPTPRDWFPQDAPWNASMAYPWRTAGANAYPGMAPYRSGMPRAEHGPARGQPRWGAAGDILAPTYLDGTWQGSDGTVLMIHGNQFRIYAGAQQQSGGVFMTYANRFIAYSPQTDTTQQYQFEMRGERLALGDNHGQIVIFQRQR